MDALRGDELRSVLEQLDTRDEPPRRLVAGETPGYHNWKVVYVDTGLEVPMVHSVDLDEGHVWQYVMRDDGSHEMEGQEFRMRRLHGEFQLEPVAPPSRPAPLSVKRLHQLGPPITGYTYPSAELRRKIDAEADEELVSDGGARQAMQYLDRDAEVDREHTLEFPYLGCIVNEGLEYVQGTSVEYSPGYVELTERVVRAILADGQVRAGDVIEVRSNNKDPEVEGSVVLHLKVPDAEAFRKSQALRAHAAGWPMPLRVLDEENEASHKSQVALARAAGWLVSTRVLYEDNDDD